MKKKLFILLTSIILTLCLAFTFTACDGDSGNTPDDTTVAVTSVELNKSSLTLDVGGEETLTATVKPDNATNKTVKWTSSKDSVATVTNGKVKAVAEGTATITATADGKSATCIVTVNKKADADISVTGVQLNKTSLTLDIDDEETLTATVKPDNATNKTVSWSSDKPAIATVTNGKVKAVAEGTAIITATAGGKSATCTVTVNKKADADISVTGVELNKNSLTLDVDGEETLTATVKPDNATNKTVSWSSDKPEIATVTNGKVKAVAEGTAIITATAGGKSATCTVTVNSPVTVTDADIKAYLDENCIDGILKKCFIAFTASKENVSNGVWFVNKDSNGNITGAEYTFNYHHDIFGDTFNVGKVEFATSVSAKDIKDGKDSNATYTQAYVVSFDASIQNTRADLTNAICDKVFGENKTATRYIVDNGYKGTDSTLGESREFIVVEITDSGVKEISIRIKNASNDAGFIAKLGNEGNYYTFNEKSYDLSGTKLVIEN